MVKFTTFIMMAVAMVIGVKAIEPEISAAIKSELVQGGVVPDVFGEFEPLTYMKVTYDDVLVENGMELLPEQTTVAPHIWFKAPTPDTQYTVIMIDLDTQVPLVRHWIATNIDGDKAGSSLRDQDRLHQFVPYKGPTPPDDGKKHRYAFALYEQAEKNQTMTPWTDTPEKHRAFFNLEEFVADNKLSIVTATYLLSSHQPGFIGDYVSSLNAIKEESEETPEKAV
ncbi:phosphatidylethanolamine-binding protein [Pilobolus umbonatus]|nr:phosphatidylethanolamine-binding protein [Pilobolus umbonatus]